MTKLKTWFYEEIQGMCILNSLMEFISWTKEGPEFTTNNPKYLCGFTLSPQGSAHPINNSEFSKPTPDGG